MNYKTGFFSFFFLLLVSFCGSAAEFTDGELRLVLHEDSGRFSLYSVADESNKPQALFSDEDPRTSFLSVMIDDRSYKMGDTSSFRTRLEGDNFSPSFVFESAFMIVTEDFSFVKSPKQAVTAGIKIQITLENRADRQITSGARFLLDTKLGEGIFGFPFTTDRRTISSETLLTRMDDDRFWTDRSDKLSLTGSFITGSPGDPDSIHIANWKKLNDVTWKAAYQSGRNFNFTPYSIRDTAVCYYFEPRMLGRGEKRSFEFILASDEGYFISTATASSSAASRGSVTSGGELILDMSKSEAANSRDQDLALLRELIVQIDSRIAAGTATEEEIIALEFALNKLRAKYGSGDNPR